MWVYGPVVCVSECVFMGPVCGSRCIYRMEICVDMISPECVIVALKTFIRMCEPVYTCPYLSVCLWVPEAVLGFLCFYLFTSL